jgi:hypothetical protein
MERKTGLGLSTVCDSEDAAETVPPWWAYAREFPRWYVWRGVTGLYYARIPGVSPQRVLRAPTPDTLRDEIVRTVAPHRTVALSNIRKRPRITSDTISSRRDHYLLQ